MLKGDESVEIIVIGMCYRYVLSNNTRGRARMI